MIVTLRDDDDGDANERTLNADGDADESKGHYMMMVMLMKAKDTGEEEGGVTAGAKVSPPHCSGLHPLQPTECQPAKPYTGYSNIQCIVFASLPWFAPTECQPAKPYGMQ